MGVKEAFNDEAVWPRLDVFLTDVFQMPRSTLVRGLQGHPSIALSFIEQQDSSNSIETWILVVALRYMGALVHPEPKTTPLPPNNTNNSTIFDADESGTDHSDPSTLPNTSAPLDALNRIKDGSTNVSRRFVELWNETRVAKQGPLTVSLQSRSVVLFCPPVAGCPFPCQSVSTSLPCPRPSATTEAPTTAAPERGGGGTMLVPGLSAAVLLVLCGGLCTCYRQKILCFGDPPNVTHSGLPQRAPRRSRDVELSGSFDETR